MVSVLWVVGTCNDVLGYGTYGGARMGRIFAVSSYSAIYLCGLGALCVCQDIFNDIVVLVGLTVCFNQL